MIVHPNEIRKAAEILKAGGVIGYPTETVYGLGGLARRADVVSRIRRLKGRQAGKPMLILIPDEASIASLSDSDHLSTDVQGLMKQFWPGPLTLVFKAKEGLPPNLTGGRDGIGIRVSSDPICQQLFRECPFPIISTSANPSGQSPARSAGEVERYFGDHLDMILDGGIRSQGMPSTVIDTRSIPMTLVREGAISISHIQSCIGDLRVPEKL